jgi:hypothetical protein
MGTDIHIVAEYFQDGRWHLADKELTEDRNYRAFAVLADVRNGYGFAGFDTGDELVPISSPRGLPDNMSLELRAMVEKNETDDGVEEDDTAAGIWLGDHSFSWVTLQELLAYDLDAPITVRGYVSDETARRYRETGEKPHSWAAWTPQPGFERIEWQVPLRESASLISTLIDEVRDLGDPSNVRLVFGFDN